VADILEKLAGRGIKVRHVQGPLHVPREGDQKTKSHKPRQTQLYSGSGGDQGNLKITAGRSLLQKCKGLDEEAWNTEKEYRGGKRKPLTQNTGAQEAAFKARRVHGHSTARANHWLTGGESPPRWSWGMDHTAVGVRKVRAGNERKKRTCFE